jgi:hypothetical protein
MARREERRIVKIDPRNFLVLTVVVVAHWAEETALDNTKD